MLGGAEALIENVRRRPAGVLGEAGDDVFKLRASKGLLHALSAADRMHGAWRYRPMACRRSEDDSRDDCIMEACCGGLELTMQRAWLNQSIGTNAEQLIRSN
jgi:hypothetical protein